MSELNNKNNKPFDDEQQNRIRLYYKMWENDPREFESKYGADGLNQLSELMRRLNAQNSDKSSGAEQVATNYMVDSLNESMENPEIETDKTKVTNPFKQITHGGAQGFGLLWNGVVDMGRGTIDPENHAKYLDLLINNRFVTSNPKRRGAIQKMFAGWKKDAVAGKKGFKSAWMRSVLEEEEINKYGRFLTGKERDFQQGLDAGGSWLKFDEIPYANEDLGMLGAAASIAVQEAMTMGPLAVLKLRRASSVANYFATKAGNSIKKSAVVTEGGKRKFRTGRVRSELAGADYEDYLKMLKAMPEKEAKRKRRLMDIYQTEGKFIKKAPFMGGGGAYAEAEIAASAMVVTGGIMAQNMLGKEYSILGEVGGGIVGPSIASRVARQGDWFTYLMYRVPGDTRAKEEKILRSMGYTSKDVVDMPPERKRKIIEQATSAPMFRGILGFGDLRGKDRRQLDSYRKMEREFNSMPDDIKDKVMERADTMRRVLDKFDDGSGRIYTTIDRAMDMAWLASIREMSRSRMRLGNTVQVKFNSTDRVLAEKELDNAKALNELLKGLGDTKFGKSANYEVFLDGIRHQLKTHLVRLSKDKGDISKQANVLLDEIAAVNNPKLNQIFDYTDVEGYAYDFASGTIQRDAFRPIKKTTDEQGRVVEQLDELGMPVREELDEASQFNAANAKTQAGKLADETRRDDILQSEGVEFVDVKLPDGTVKKILRPKSKLTQAQINENAKGATDFVNTLKKTADQDTKKAYQGIKGFDVSPTTRGSAISNSQVDNLIVNMGDRIGTSLDDIPKDLRPVINIKGMGDVTIGRFFVSKRSDSLERLRKKIGDEEFIAEMEKLLEGTSIKISPEDFKRVDVDPVTGEKTITNEIDSSIVDDLVNHVANQLNVNLLKEGVQEMTLDIPLSQLAKIRTSLYQNATQQITTDGSRVSGLYNFKMGKVLSDAFDDIDSFKGANQLWRDKVGRPYREGIGRMLVENQSISGDRMFQQFVRPKGGAYTSAKEDFIALFGNADGTVNPVAVDWLTKSVQQVVDEGKSIPEPFFRTFGDVLNIPYKSEDVVAAGKEAFKTMAKREQNVTGQLDSLNKNAELKVRENEKTFQKFAELNPEFNPYGIPTQAMEDLFGKDAFDAVSLRRTIIKDTYEGGDPARVRAIAKYINAIPDAAKRKTAQSTLQKTLWDGAIEEAYRRKTTSGVGYAQETVKFAEDGTPIGTEMGRLYENMEVDSSAMQVYLERNRKVLEEVLDPTDFQDLEELTGLVTLVVGDMGKQAVENFPQQLRLNSIMSRVYGIARGVISPRYVITELLIQDARFRRGQLIKDMATDPDSFALLTDVLLKEGFTKPRIRQEFAQKWWGTMVRYARTMSQEEIEQESEYAWEAATS